MEPGLLDRSREAAECAIRARMSVASPMALWSLTCLSHSTSGEQREGREIMNLIFEASTAATISSDCFVVIVSAFSVKTCFPAATARRITS